MTNSYKTKQSAGFTIVELIIIIVVIAILVSITIVSYAAVTENAKKQTVKTDAQTVATLINKYKSEKGSYPTTIDDLTDVKGVQSTYQYDYNATAGTYCLTASVNGASAYVVSNNSLAKEGGCPGHGVNGGAAIVNLATNPGLEVNNSGYTFNALTNASVTDWKAGGTRAMQVTPNAATNDTFVTVGGDLGAFRSGMQPGKTYTISATFRLTGAISGTLSGNGSRQATAWYTTAGGAHIRANGNQLPNAAGFGRSSVTYTIPSDATAAWVRLYYGGSTGSGTMWIDNIMITEGSTLHGYADGSSANWVWDGTANASTSRGPSL